MQHGPELSRLGSVRQQPTAEGRPWLLHNMQAFDPATRKASILYTTVSRQLAYMPPGLC